MAANTCSSIWVALLWIFLATPTDLTGVINDSKVTKSRTIANINETAPAGAITDSKVTESRTIGNTNETAPDFPKVHVDYQFLVIACAALAALLLASVFIFSVIIFRLQKQKRKSILNASLPRSNGRWTLRESKEPEFSLQISPLCAAPSPRLRSREPVVAAIPLVPVTTTTLEDEEDYGFSSAPPQPLVTFHNPFPNAEEKEPQAATMGKHSDSNQCRRLRSVTSEGTSSTSSEEQNWYENYRLQGEQNNLLFAPQPYEDSSEYDDVSSAASD
ncbi:uncharacterized protein [Eleutherodactylus coqui]|uniref:uncharacterized protein isoform X1 n=1 Tax=Eleutherodactylus coqui TaxID=57060 RepID=UPI00346255F3